MPVLIPECLKEPNRLTDRQAEAYHWALDMVTELVDDGDWKRDNPHYATSVAEQYGDMIYRLTDQAKAMVRGSDTPAQSRGFAKAAENAAMKLANWYFANVFPGEKKA